jgi:nitrogen fixation NifU-like protein
MDMENSLNDLYRDILLDHYKYPRGNRSVESPDVENEGQNPLCGDSLKIQARIENGRIEDIGIKCSGCAICAASSSMLADIVKGKSITTIRELTKIVKSLIKGDEKHGSNGFELGDLEALEGVRKFPVRIKCALLSWTTLSDGLDAWEKGEKNKVSSTE